MPEVTLKVSDTVYSQAKLIAEQTGQPIETVLAEWMNSTLDNMPIDLLSDEQVLAFADAMMSEEQQDELNRLLSLNSEGNITDMQQSHLDKLMSIYRKGLVLKAQAMKVVVKRGLRSANIDEWPESSE